MFILSGELLKQSWKVYLKNLKSLLPYIGLNILLLAACFGFPLTTFYLAEKTSSIGLAILTVILYIVCLCTAIYGGMWLHVAMIKAARNAVENKIVGVSEVLKKSRTLILPMFGTTLLKVFLIYLGLLAFLIPGIIMLGYYAFAEMAVIYDEPKEGAAAIRISKSLVKGRWWGMLIRWFFAYLVPVLIVVLISYLFSLPFKGRIANAEISQPVKTQPALTPDSYVVSDRVPYSSTTDYNDSYDDYDFDNYNLDSYDSIYNTELNRLVDNYSKEKFGSVFFPQFTIRYFVFMGVLTVLSLLLSPYFLVVAGILYVSAKENEVKNT